MDEENDKFFIMKDYSLGIQTITYPEDILSSEVAKSDDFGEAVEDMEDVDFVVVGPVEKEFYTSTLSLSLDKLTPVHLKEDAMLLTIYPTKIASTDAAKLDQFYNFVPSPKYFRERDQTVLETCNKSPLWPPFKQDDRDGKKLSSWTPKLSIGGTQSHVTFKLYDRNLVNESNSTSDDSSSTKKTNSKPAEEHSDE